jgi:hypothetical protein
MSGRGVGTRPWWGGGGFGHRMNQHYFWDMFPHPHQYENHDPYPDPL